MILSFPFLSFLEGVSGFGEETGFIGVVGREATDGVGVWMGLLDLTDGLTSTVRMSSDESSWVFCRFKRRPCGSMSVGTCIVSGPFLRLRSGIESLLIQKDIQDDRVCGRVVISGFGVEEGGSDLGVDSGAGGLVTSPLAVVASEIALSGSVSVGLGGERDDHIHVK